MQKTGFKFRSSKPTERNEIVQLLSRNFENVPEYWNWKYLANPNIDPSLLMVVEKEGKIVGCGCWLPRILKISGRLEVNSLMAAHITIDREFRKQGLGEKLVESIRTTKAFKKNVSVVSLSLILEAPLYKNYYKRITKHIPVSKSTIVYAKFLTCKQLRKQIDALNKKIQSRSELALSFSKLNLAVRFLLKGAPPFLIRFSTEGIQLKEGETALTGESFSLTVKGDFMFVKEMTEGCKGIVGLITGLLRRKIGLRGNPMSLPKLYKAYKLIKKAYQT